MSEPAFELKDGEFFRLSDDKKVAYLDEKGEIEGLHWKLEKHREELEALMGADGPPSRVADEVKSSDPRIPTEQPERDPTLGAFSPKWVNWDHANLSDEEFEAKYARTAASKLDLIARKPSLFADLEALEDRLGKFVA